MTIDDDLFALLEARARRENRSVREVVNDALRRALVPQRKGAPYRVRPHDSPLQPGVDPRRLNQLADELEDEDRVRRLRK